MTTTRKGPNHFSIVWVLRSYITAFNWLLTSSIISWIARMRIAAFLTLGQKNVCGRLKLLASCLKFLDVAWCTKCHKEVRLTDLTDKKLRLQIAGMVICEYAVTYLAHATSSYCKRLPQKKWVVYLLSFLTCALTLCRSSLLLVENIFKIINPYAMSECIKSDFCINLNIEWIYKILFDFIWGRIQYHILLIPTL